ncbi:MAG: Thiol-disulfide isomerase or thioredoxin [Mucilaginibacter sp.]|nr:Thiol-disulfide isomerase or thioredoxin [Mucilaginibacter sp.]
MTKMKKYLLFLLSFLPIITLAQQNYTIKGTFKGIDGPGSACVFYKIDGKPVSDTGIIKGGKFIIKGTVPYAVLATVFIRPVKYSFIQEPNRSDQIDVYLENGTITINTPDSLKYAMIGGTQLNVDCREVVKLLTPFKIEMEALKIAQREADVIRDFRPILKAAYVELASRQEPAQEAFINAHLHSLVGLDLLTKAVDPAFNLVKAKSLFAKFPKELRESVSGKAYSHLFDVALGCQAPDFTAQNLKDENVKLSDYKGKYVLLDFWASWCMPCRADNPHVKKLYEQYKGPNFAILGVSVDRAAGKKYWIKAINDDGITWDQVSELKGFQGTAPMLYSITAVPTNFLIDPSGKIIAKNLRGEDLDKVLASLLTKTN